MTASLLKTGLVVIAWLVFLQRGYIVYKGKYSHPKPPASKYQGIVWASSFFLLLAGTTWSNAYVQFVSAHFEWFLHVPKVVFGVTGFVVCLYGCIRFIMLDRYLVWSEWVIVAGLLVIIDFTLLEWIGWQVLPGQRFGYERLAGLILKSYLLIGTLKIGLPTIRWCQPNEPGIIIKIRLDILWWFGFFFATWMVVDVIVLVLALGTESSVFAVPSILGFLLTFILGLFVPDRFYKRYLVFLYHIGTFLCVRLVELLAYFELASDHKHCALSWHEVLRSPEHATYKSVISVLDSSKMLCAQPESTAARSLGQRISLVHDANSNYLGVVNHLRGVGAQYWTSIETLKMSYSLLLAQSKQSPHPAATQ